MNILRWPVFPRTPICTKEREYARAYPLGIKWAIESEARALFGKAATERLLSRLAKPSALATIGALATDVSVEHKANTMNEQDPPAEALECDIERATEAVIAALRGICGPQSARCLSRMSSSERKWIVCV